METKINQTKPNKEKRQRPIPVVVSFNVLEDDGVFLWAWNNKVVATMPKQTALDLARAILVTYE